MRLIVFILCNGFFVLCLFLGELLFVAKKWLGHYFPIENYFISDWGVIIFEEGSLYWSWRCIHKDAAQAHSGPGKASLRDAVHAKTQFQFKNGQPSNMPMATICQWLQYANGYNMPMATICQWLQYANGYNMPMATICQWLQYANGYNMPMATICQWLQYANGYNTNGYNMPMATICQWLQYVNSRYKRGDLTHFEEEPWPYAGGRSTSSKMTAIVSVTSQDGRRFLATVAKDAMTSSKMASMATVTPQDGGRCQGLAMGKG